LKNVFKNILKVSRYGGVFVDYHKPGAPLAQAVSKAMQAEKKGTINVILLQNHGVVMGGENVDEVLHLLEVMTAALSTRPLYETKTVVRDVSSDKEDKIQHSIQLSGQLPQGYVPISDSVLSNLAIHEDLFSRLKSSWAICPDHVVFLGAEPYLYEDEVHFQEQYKTIQPSPLLVFIKNRGVFVCKDFNMAKCLQLRCYYDVMVRQKNNQELNILSHSEIGELLNWDAEQYRMTISK
jgi:rhamnose utilization protein RhaD (predicted bifunctional aldolase and dehydrogenase)